jgi:hypothetical protein
MPAKAGIQGLFQKRSFLELNDYIFNMAHQHTQSIHNSKFQTAQYLANAHDRGSITTNHESPRSSFPHALYESRSPGQPACFWRESRSFQRSGPPPKLVPAGFRRGACGGDRALGFHTNAAGYQVQVRVGVTEMTCIRKPVQVLATAFLEFTGFTKGRFELYL